MQIIIINVLAFLVLLTINLIKKFIIGSPQEIESYLSVSPQWANFKPWTLFTYSFVTQYPFTLLCNMILLNTFGNIIVSLLGNNRLITLYVFGTIAGGIAFLLAYNFVPFFIKEAAQTPLIGASAGIYAVMVGAATFAPNFSFFLFPFISSKLKYIVIFILVSTLAALSYGSESYEVIIAKIGGALWGYFYIWYLRLLSTSSWEPWTFWTRMRTKFKKKTSSNSFKKRNNRQTSQKKIDIILDKISTHGYKNLTNEEKQSLFNAGK